jgi:hypothetical protein
MGARSPVIFDAHGATAPVGLPRALPRDGGLQVLADIKHGSKSTTVCASRMALERSAEAIPRWAGGDGHEEARDHDQPLARSTHRVAGDEEHGIVGVGGVHGHVADELVPVDGDPGRAGPVRRDECRGPSGQ